MPWGKEWGLNQSVRALWGVPEILLRAEHHFERLWEVQRPSPFLGTFMNLQELGGNCMVTLAKMCPAELWRGVEGEKESTGNQSPQAAGSSMHRADAMPCFLSHKYFIIFPCETAIKCTVLQSSCSCIFKSKDQYNMLHYRRGVRGKINL